MGLAALLASILLEIWFVFVLPSFEGPYVFQMAFNGFILAIGLVASIVIRRSNRKQDQLLNFSITGRNSGQLPERVSPIAQGYLEERMVIVGTLLARAAGEVYLVNRELPLGGEVVTRLVQNSVLRTRRLWEKLEPAEMLLASSADGRWTDEQRMEILTWCEQLRLLRWTLAVDAELVPLAHFPQVDYKLLRELLQPGDSPQSNGPIRPSWDLRIERDIAREYCARIVAELDARSLLTDGPELGPWVREFRDQSLGGSTDYLAGAKTIGELEEDALWLLGTVAHARARYAGYLVDQLTAAEPLPFSEWPAGDQDEKFS